MSLFLRRFGIALLASFLLVSLGFATESPKTFSVSKTYNNSPFSYKMSKLKDRGDFVIYRLTYPSPVTSEIKSNNTIPANYYLPKKLAPGVKYPAVICLHPLDANEYLTDLLCVTVVTQGIPALSFKLPYYGERNGGRGPEILLETPERFLNAISQGIEDIRRTVDLLASREEVDATKLGVAGISLGAIVAATAAACEPRLNRADMILGGGDLQKVIGFSRETALIHKMIERLPPEDKRRVNEKIKSLDPLELAPALRDRAQAGKVLMINATEDEIIPPSCTEKLAKALGIADKVVWLKGVGHYSAMSELPTAMRLTAEFFAQDLPGGKQTKKEVPALEQPADQMKQIGSFIGQVVTLLSTDPKPDCCHRAELEITFTDPTGKQRTATFKLVRGAENKFALQCKLPELGELHTGNGANPWLIAGGKTAIIGSLNGTANVNPFAGVDEQHIMKLKMVIGIGSGMVMAPAMLEQWIVVDEVTRKENNAGPNDKTLRITPKQGSRLPGELLLDFRGNSLVPENITFTVGKAKGKIVVREWKTNVDCKTSDFEPPAELPKKEVEQGDLCRMFAAVVNFAGDKFLPQIGPRPNAKTSDKITVVARDPAGNGILCRMGAKTIVMVSGTPQEMGTAQGVLLGEAMKKIVGRTVYLIGAGDTVISGIWFFDRMAEIERRTKPFTPLRFFEECDALGRAVGISQRDSRYANLFPERFHCSGIALRGKATVGGKVLHARVLDYMRDIDLQTAAVIQVFMPKGLNKWMSHGYAGFVGSVTAINEKGLAIGQMGGRGEGLWDGMPMSFLMREIMERASTVEEAVEIFKKTPRTCEYYYIVSDRWGEMRALECTPDKVNVLKPGEQESRLPHIPEDTVLISGPDRAKWLVERVEKNYGRIDVEKLIEIIKRPVAMQSNLHNAIFAPETLDMWFADAGRDTLACNEPYAHVNLRELLNFYEENRQETAKPAKKDATK